MSAVDLAVFGAMVLIGLAMLVWMVALMYRAFAVSCNVSGGKAIGVFIGLLTVGEIVSKIAIVVLFSMGGM